MTKEGCTGNCIGECFLSLWRYKVVGQRISKLIVPANISEFIRVHDNDTIVAFVGLAVLWPVPLIVEVSLMNKNTITK